MSNKKITNIKTQMWVSYSYTIDSKINNAHDSGVSNIVLDGSEKQSFNSIVIFKKWEQSIAILMSKTLNLPLECINITIINWKRLER